MTAPRAARPSEISGTGHTVWRLPDSALRLFWPGPGSGLFLLIGDGMVRIEHRSADATYDTRRDAGRAVAAFIAAGSDA